MKEQTKKKNFISCLLSYAKESKFKMILSVILSVISLISGLVPFYCFYRVIDLFLEDQVSVQGILLWSVSALAHMIPEGSGHIVLPLVSMIAPAVMLSMSMVGSIATLEVMGNEINRVQLTVEELQEYLEMPELPEKKAPAGLPGGERQRIAIAHRLSTIKNADNIVVLKDGKLEALDLYSHSFRICLRQCRSW